MKSRCQGCNALVECPTLRPSFRPICAECSRAAAKRAVAEAPVVCGEPHDAHVRFYRWREKTLATLDKPVSGESVYRREYMAAFIGPKEEMTVNGVRFVADPNVPPLDPYDAALKATLKVLYRGGLTDEELFPRAKSR